MFSAQLILLLGGMLLLGGATMGASGIVGGLAELVMVWIASMLTALELGRTWDPFKQHLRDVGLGIASGIQVMLLGKWP